MRSKVIGVLDAFKSNIAVESIPELRSLAETIYIDPEKFVRIFHKYAKIVNGMSSLTTEDIQFLVRFHDLKDESKSNSASDANLPTFYNELSAEKIGLLSNFVRYALNPDSLYAPVALKDLSEMMEMGSYMNKQEGFVPQDGDGLSDELIWGHTQIKADDPEVLIHFAICHYLERYMSIKFQMYGLEMASHKDWFLNMIGDMLILKYAQGDESFSNIIKLWVTPKSEGGLGWISEDSIDKMRIVLSA